MEFYRDISDLYATVGLERILMLNANVPEENATTVSCALRGHPRQYGTVDYNDIVLFVIKDTHRDLVGGKLLLTKDNFDYFKTTVPSLSQHSSNGTRLAPSLSFHYRHNLSVPVHFALDLDICDKQKADELSRTGIDSSRGCNLHQLGERLTKLLTASLCQPPMPTTCEEINRQQPKTLQNCKLIPHISQRTAHGGVHILWTGGAVNFDTLLKIRSVMESSVKVWLAKDLNLRIDTGASGTLVPGSSKTGLHDDVYKDITTGFSDPTLPWCPDTGCCRNSSHYETLLTPSTETLNGYLTNVADEYWCKKTCPVFASPPSSPSSDCPRGSDIIRHHPRNPDSFSSPFSGGSVRDSDDSEFDAFCGQIGTFAQKLPTLSESIALHEKGDALWMWETVLHNHLFTYLRNYAFHNQHFDDNTKYTDYDNESCNKYDTNMRQGQQSQVSMHEQSQLPYDTGSRTNLASTQSTIGEMYCTRVARDDDSSQSCPFSDDEDNSSNGGIGDVSSDPETEFIKSVKRKHEPSILEKPTGSVKRTRLLDDLRHCDSQRDRAEIGEALVCRMLEAMSLIARAVVVLPTYRNQVLLGTINDDYGEKGDIDSEDGDEDPEGIGTTKKRKPGKGCRYGTEGYVATHAARLVESWISGGYSAGFTDDRDTLLGDTASQNKALVRWVRQKLSRWYHDPATYPALPKTGGIGTLVGIYSLINLALNLPESAEDDEKYSVRSTHVDVQISLNKLAVKICDLYIKQNPQESNPKYELFVDLVFALLFPVVEIPDQERELMWVRNGLWVATTVKRFGSIAASTLAQLQRLKICASHPKTGEPVAVPLFTRVIPSIKQMFEKSKAIWLGLTTMQSSMPNALLLTANNQYFSLVTRQVHYCSLFHVYTDWAHGLGVTLEVIQEAVDNVQVVWKLFTHLIKDGYNPQPVTTPSPGSGSQTSKIANSLGGVYLTSERSSSCETIFNAAGIGTLEPAAKKYLKVILKGFHYFWEVLRHPLPRDCLEDCVTYDKEITSARIQFVVSHLATIVFRRNPKFIWFLYSSLPNTSKSTLLRIVREFLGERFTPLTAANISKGGTSGDLKRPDLINLSHRFAYGVDEIPTGLAADKRSEIDNETIRQITGDMTTSGYRDLRKNNSDKKIKFCGALFIACNQLPVFKTDVALNERLVFTQFENTFPRKANIDLEDRIKNYMVPSLLAFTLADYYMRLSIDAKDKGPDHERGIAFYQEILKEGPVEDFLAFDRTLHWAPRGQGDVTLGEISARVNRFALSRPDCTEACKQELIQQLKNRGHYDHELDIFECLTTQGIQEQAPGKNGKRKQPTAVFQVRQPVTRDLMDGTNSRGSCSRIGSETNAFDHEPLQRKTSKSSNRKEGVNHNFDLFL